MTTFRTTHADRDWPEDSSHENGNYFCTCFQCGKIFIGHKRRVICKLCASVSQPENSE